MNPVDTPQAVAAFVQRVRSHDPEVRGQAWPEADRYGPPALAPLADALLDEDFEVPRAAKRAMWAIVRWAGRPGAAGERCAAQQVLLGLLQHRAATVRREAAWLLSVVGDAACLGPLATLLQDPEVREDVRCALLRLPAPGRAEVFRQAMAQAPLDFRYALADALRLLGEEVAGYPSRKLVPTRHHGLSKEDL